MMVHDTPLREEHERYARAQAAAENGDRHN